MGADKGERGESAQDSIWECGGRAALRPEPARIRKGRCGAKGGMRGGIVKRRDLLLTYRV